MSPRNLLELHDAARAGDVQRIEALLAQGVPVGGTDDCDLTALDYAACFGQLEAAQVLLRHGAQASRGNRHGDTPLRLAESRGHDDMADLLRQHGAGRAGPVSEWFRLNKNVWSVAKLDDPPDDQAFWRSRTPHERLQGLEYLRRMNYGPAATARLQRVFEVVDRSQG